MKPNKLSCNKLRSHIPDGGDVKMIKARAIFAGKKHTYYIYYTKLSKFQISLKQNLTNWT